MALWTCDLVGASISRANAEQRMLQKLTRSLTEDIAPLLPPDVVFNDAAAIAAFERVWFTLIGSTAIRGRQRRPPSTSYVSILVPASCAATADNIMICR